MSMADTRTVEPADLFDEFGGAPVTASNVVYEGRVWDVVSDDVDLGGGHVVTRDYVKHPGAVAVLAMRGDAGDEEIFVIRQYRHPIRTTDWEIPAGLLDIAGEAPHVGAARELYEEADLQAGHWAHLIDYAGSPGGLSEQLRIYLARDVSLVPEAERFERDDEEADMRTGWVRLDDVLDAAMVGRIHNPALLIAAFAADRARRSGFAQLRPADIPWESHPAFRSARE